MDKLNRYTNQEQEPDHECGFVSENTREWKPRVRFEVVSNAPEKYHDSQFRSAIMVYLYDTEVGAIVHQERRGRGPGHRCGSQGPDQEEDGRERLTWRARCYPAPHDGRLRPSEYAAAALVRPGRARAAEACRRCVASSSSASSD